MTPAVARLLSAQLRPFGFCRTPLQSAATFTVPFVIRPDPDAAGFFGPRYLQRLAAHSGTRSTHFLARGRTGVTESPHDPRNPP